MKKITYLGLTIVALIFSAGVFCKEKDVPPPKLGQPLELKFQAVDGREVDLSALKGKVVLIDFWATWCGPCVAEVPHVKAAYDKFHDQGFEIVCISLDEQKEKLTRFTNNKSMPWPQYFDGKGWDNQFVVKFGISAIPEMWLMDREGNLCDRNAQKNLATKIEKLLGSTKDTGTANQTQKSGVERSKSPEGNGRSAEFEALIQRLGSADFNEREAATQAIKKLGASALPALLDAKARCSDAEILSRLDAILWENRPVTELISEFAKLRKEIADLSTKLEELDADNDADTDEDEKTADNSEQEKLENRLDSLNEELAAMCDRILQKYPQSAETVDVLEYLLVEADDIDDTQVEKALAALTEHHAVSKQAGKISYLLYQKHTKDPDSDFPSVSHVEKLARAIIKKSEHEESKALASLTLAYVLMSMADESNGNTDRQRECLMEAKGLLTTIEEKYGTITLPHLAEDNDDQADEADHKISSGEVAKRLLFEINNLMPGKAAPQLTGAYLDGKEFKLSDLKGSVVVLHFWKFGEGEILPDSEKFDEELGIEGKPITAPLKKMENRPFVLITINGDDDLEALEESKVKQTINWHSVDDIRGDDRPDISQEWSVRRWPTTYVIDHKGVIRHKWANTSSDSLMGKEIEDLVKEAETQGNGKPAAKTDEAESKAADSDKYIDDEERTKHFFEALSKLAAEGKCLGPKTMQRRLHKSSCTLNLTPPNNQVLSPEEVYERCQRSVFLLGSVTGSGKDAKHFEESCSATAFAVTTNGVLLTNRHVFEKLDGDRFGVMNFKGEVFPVVDILAVSRESDLAVIRVDGKGFEPLPVAADTKVGSWVGVLSNPGGQLFTFTQGHVTRFTKSTTDKKTEKWMNISAEYACGSSGAPILNRYGAVVGVATNTECISDENDADDESDTLDSKNKTQQSKGDGKASAVSSGSLQMIVKSAVPSQEIIKFIHGQN